MANFTHLSSLNVQGSVETSTQGKLVGSFSTMPAPSSLNAGQIVLYTGETGTYTKGKFYISTGTAWELSEASPETVVVDSALSSTSTNPVQNKVVNSAIVGLQNSKQDKLTIDSSPVSGSGNPVSSGGVYTELAGKLPATGTAVKATADADGNTISTTYLKSATAASTYLTQSNAASTYLTQNSAGTTYLKQTDATNTYVSKTDASNTYATKTELSGAIGSVYRYKSSVASYANLPTSGQAVGDVYNVEAAYGNVPAGTNWAWNGTTWDALAGTVDLSPYAKSTDVANTYATKSEVSSGYATKTELTNGLAGKQNTLTFDSTPTSGSSNPVTSGGVYSAINGKQNKVLISTSSPTSSDGSDGDIWIKYA